MTRLLFYGLTPRSPTFEGIVWDPSKANRALEYQHHSADDWVKAYKKTTADVKAFVGKWGACNCKK